MKAFLAYIPLVAAAVGGCNSSPSSNWTPPVFDEPTPARAPTPPSAPGDVTTGSAKSAVVSSTAVAGSAKPEPPRASGNGFTVVLAPGWEAQPDPSNFKAARHGTSTIAINAGSSERSKSELITARTDAVACDALFENFAASLKLDKFIARTPVGCEREGTIAGMVMIGMIQLADSRPYMVMCGGAPSDRAEWEPECRAIAASMRWDTSARAMTAGEPAVSSEPLGGGRMRAVSEGVAIDLVAGWKLTPGTTKGIALTAMRESGFGLLTFGVVDSPWTIANARDCRERASVMTEDSGGKLASSTLDGKRCLFAMETGATITEMAILPGPKQNAIWIACVRTTGEATMVGECKSMIDSVAFAR